MIASDILPPPELRDSPINWAKKNLFSPWYNAIITVVLLALLAYGLYNFIDWATTQARWDVIPRNLNLFVAGTYPRNERWRLWVLLGIIAVMSGLSWGVIARSVAKLYSRNILIGIAIAAVGCLFVPTLFPFRLLLLAMLGAVVGMAWVGQQIGRKVPSLGQWVALNWFLVLIVGWWLIGGGLGLREIRSSSWQGLMLNVLTAVISILLSFPLGVIMALGRRSSLPVVRALSVAYIEIFRGIPLVTILFLGQVMVPLFLPAAFVPDNVFRAIIGLTLFSSAYLAENVRGGLQSIPRGQSEAASALGLSVPLTLGLIVLPQALKAVIPAIVGQFISLFQDTTLLSLVGLVEVLKMSRSILANSDFGGRFIEVYLFDALLFWCFCYAMSAGSRWVERKLNTEHR